MLGFENHLNLLHENKHGLPELLVRGLAVFLNMTAVDESFRRFNGHTQVNATDLKLMKYPSREALLQLGKWAKQAALPVVSQIDRDKINRINKRAWNLAQAAYEDYRTRMMEDPLVKTGAIQPEEWQPIEASKDVLELIRATATTLAAASRAMNRRGDSLAKLVGVE